MAIACALMDGTGSGARPAGTTPEQVALAGFSPDAHAEVVGVQYGSDDVATVEVGFPGQGPHYYLQIHRWGENDWRHEKPIIDDPLIDPGRDLAEQLVGRRFGRITIEDADGHISQGATGETVYSLHVRLSGPGASLEELRLIGRAVTSHARRSGVMVSMTHTDPGSRSEAG